MRLLSLRMRNFRQHADTEITFRPGLTGIIGPNGAGKSTILEALAWGIYGASAARGTNDTIRFSRAGARSRVEVELAFALGGHEYRVQRSLYGAEVYLDGGAQPVASGVGGVTSYLQSRVGMSREEFFNTYFTGQKELQFLAAMGPADRGRFLSQVLGYERLRRAQELVRARRNDLRSEIKGLRASLGDRDELVAALDAAQARVRGLRDALITAQRAVSEAVAAEQEVAPRWQAVQAARERHRELTHAIDTAERDRQSARRELERLEAELQAVAAAEKELAPLRARLEELPEANAACERFSELARQEERRKALTRQLADLQAELERAAERREKLESAPELEKRYTGELEQLREKRETVATTLDEKKSAWLADKQDAFTKLSTYRDRAAELKGQIAEIERLGPEGICPTCGRPVGNDYARLLDELQDQWTVLVQDGKWWAKRHEQLEPKPDDVGELETLLRQLGEAVDDRARKLTRCQSALHELQQLTADMDAREGRRVEVRDELGAIPGGYDAKAHRAAEERLRELREVEKRAARLDETANRGPRLRTQLVPANEREAAAVKAADRAQGERDALEFSEDAFAAVRDEHARRAEARRTAELGAAEAKGDVNTAEQVLQGAEHALAQYDERAQAVREHEADLHYHEELDEAYTHLRQELNDQVRPELSEIASAFLAQLTDGRYTSMEIDESYNLMVLDEGEEKPVISGGEEDIANLVLRLSLSQMIAERAGHPLSLLILDEVFGSLDVSRRDNVVQLLHHLEDRFEQVILITHIEGIRESLDQVLRVEYDERAGCSRVSEESVMGEDYPEAPMAAD
ncbi:SMC family ATPase [Longimicrobium sp.]|uniref:SMC family ATPase n=1 Tax=Longimicrobium sp. TaxID=2029185 RepID=UPI002E3104A1|nr:SMC family ATPase [Longimicrobium sp.]HEX6040092.1 SMC family ATPase [Longimicrobium sp.]